MEWGAYAIYALVQILVSAALIVLTAKDPESNLKAKNLDDFHFPTAEEDRAIPYVVGDVLVDGPNLTWYGNLRVVALTTKVAKNGVLGNHKNVVVGFEYYVGFEIALCLGPVDSLKEIWYGENKVYDGNWTSETSYLTIDKSSLFGGPKNGGGIRFRVDFRRGTATQRIIDYMAAVDGFDSAPFGYRHFGICKLAFRGPSPVLLHSNARPTLSGTFKASGYIGETTSVEPVKARLLRYPNQLGIPGGRHILPSGANAAAVLYELITGAYFPYTSTRIAPGLETYEVGIASFLASAETLYTENMGISFQWQRDTPPRDLVDDILVHINGILREDPDTGKVDLVLLRGGYDVESLPVFDRSNILELEGVQRQAISAIVNRVTYKYTDTSEGFPVKTASVTSNAGLFMSGAEAAVTLDLSMFHDGSVANRRAQTHLNSLCSPIFSGGMVTDLRAWNLRVGDRFVLNWESGDPDISSVTGLVCIANRISYAGLEEGKITVGFSQDVFSLGNSVYETPPNSEWIPPSGSPAVVTSYRVIELPYGLLGGATPNILALWADSPNETSTHVEVFTEVEGGGYAAVEDLVGFHPTTLLIEDVDANARVSVTSGSLQAWRADMSDFIYSSDSGTVDPEYRDINYLYQVVSADDLNARKVNLFLIDDEIFGVLQWAQESDEVWSLFNVLRGMYGTLPAPHAAGSIIRKLGQATILDSVPMTTGQEWSLKLRAHNFGGYLSLEDIPEITGTIAGNAGLPYPPAGLQLDGVGYAATATLPVVVAWNRRDKNNSAYYHAGHSSPSFGETYTIVIENALTDVVLRTVTGITSNTWTYTALMSQEDGDIANLRISISTVLGADTSPPMAHEFEVTGGWL